MIKKVPVEEAIGEVIAHDMTQVIPNEFKGPRFRKGKIIEESDVPILKQMGKEHIYIVDLDGNQLHEDEAAQRLSQLVDGEHLDLTTPTEGKIYLQAACPGLLKIDKELLFAANRIKDILLTAGHNNSPVAAGENLMSVRVNPLIIDEELIQQTEELLAEEELIKLLPFSNPQVGIVVTGNEVYTGKVEDAFVPAMKRKFKRWGGQLLNYTYVPDDKEAIKDAICQMKEEGAEIIITSGGMSVDADDVTSQAIAATGAEVIHDSIPAAPGNKLMTAYLDEVPILGLPAAIIFYRVTVLDLIYPRLLAGERISKEDIIRLSHGGLCHQCNTCQYPHCSFGKGE
ncbi:MAG: molybdopterin-binding protein [Bacillota bacterium]